MPGRAEALPDFIEILIQSCNLLKEKGFSRTKARAWGRSCRMQSISMGLPDIEEKSPQLI